MRTLAAAAVLLILMAGCTTPGTDEGPEPTATPGPAPPETLAEPTMLAPQRLGAASFGAEPNIEVAPDGAVYVSTPLGFWRSDDGGATYQGIGAVQCEAALGFVPPEACPPGYETHNPGLVGGGDGALASDAQGRLYWAGLFGGGQTVPFQYSDDRGEAWTDPVDAAHGQSGDREWIDATDDGRVFVNWRSGGGGDESGVWVSRSHDRGDTWDEDPIRVGDDQIGGPIVHDPVTGNLYIPLSGFDASLGVAVSTDGGAGWNITEVHRIEGDTVEGFRLLATSIFPSLDVDDQGNLYMVWAAAQDPTLPKQAERPGVFYTVSTDRGGNWSEPQLISDPGPSALFPWVAAGAEGRIVVAWYQNRLGMPSESSPDLWDVHLAQTITALDEEPVWVRSIANTDPIHAGSVCTSGTGCALTAGDRSLLDFFEVDINAQGHPVVAWAADAPTPMFDAIVWAGGVAKGTSLR